MMKYLDQIGWDSAQHLLRKDERICKGNSR